MHINVHSRKIFSFRSIRMHKLFRGILFEQLRSV